MRLLTLGGPIINWIFSLWRLDWEFFSPICNLVWVSLQYSVSKSTVFSSAVAISLSQCQKAGSESRKTKSVSRVAVILANPIFRGFCSISVSPINCRNFLENSPRTMSFEAMIKSDGHLGNAHHSNARHSIVPEVPDFSRGCFSVSVNQPQSP
jgi:hypothetical protein